MAHRKGSCSNPSPLEQTSPTCETRMERPRSGPPECLRAWYQPGADDFIYKEALDACQASKSRLAKYLSPDDVLLLPDKVGNLSTEIFDAKAVEKFVQERCREATEELERSKIKWLSDATCSLASVAGQLSDILAPLVPQSPEFTIPFGCLMIIFKILVAKQDKREKAVAIFDNLQQKLTSLELYRIALPTEVIKLQLAKTYIDILDLVVCVTEWCAIGRISKLVDVVSLKPRFDFDEGLQRVEESHKKLKGLVKEAIAAVVVDSNETLKSHSRKIDYIADQSDDTITNIATLSQIVDTLRINQIKQTKVQLVQTRKWSDDLIDTLLPDTNTGWEESNMWQSRAFRLSPKDHWEVNGLLDYLQKWNQLERASILAIFGPTDIRDTWVTEFSLDMIQAFQVQNVLVSSAMCDRPAGQIFTPTIVIKKLICQLLEQSPELILEAPEILNSRIFHRVIGFDQACFLFRSIVARLNMPLAIIVDRIDCCEADTADSNASQDLVGFLAELLEGHPQQVKVITTSADEPPDDADLPDGLAVSTCMIATRTRPLHKEAYYLGTGRRRITFDVTSYSSGFNEIKDRQAVGLEKLYKLRRSMDRDDNDIRWDKYLKARTTRQKMICRYFGLQNRVNTERGGAVWYFGSRRFK